MIDVTDPGRKRGTITVRKMPFEYPDDLRAHWNPAQPEWSHIVNGCSILMPYLEPFLIDTIREAIPKITDPGVLTEAKAYCGQESQHFKQHARFNKLVRERGYQAVEEEEAAMEASYDRLRKKSLGFRLAYAAGFETMALVIGNMLVTLREDLFENSDPNVTSLVLWHFVEELEHKRSAFDVYMHVDGRYWMRIYGLLYAMVHAMSHARKAYVRLLKIDGRWGKLATRWNLKRVLAKIFAECTPGFLESFLPTHDPATHDDPEWVKDWIRLYDAGETRLARLDTRRMKALPSEALA